MYLAQATIDDIEKRTRLKWWSDDPSKIPHPATWINSKRWEDEGWEGETESGKRPPRRPRHRPESEVKELPPMCWEERVLGRLFASYCVKAGGLSEVRGALEIKHDMLGSFVPDYREEIEAERMTIDEVEAVLRGVFVARMDKHYGLNIGDRILAGRVDSGE